MSHRRARLLVELSCLEMISGMPFALRASAFAFIPLAIGTPGQALHIFIMYGFARIL